MSFTNKRNRIGPETEPWGLQMTQEPSQNGPYSRKRNNNSPGISLTIKTWEKVNFRSQILECPSIGQYWNIFGVPVLPENVILTFFRTC